jgi:TRAP-type C4-dicarboxylate transport system permease small subunit
MMQVLRGRHVLQNWDASIAALALCGMVLIPVIEVLLRPIQGSGIDNAPVLVQHLGLLFSLAGAVYAERTGHLTSLGALWRDLENPLAQKLARAWVFLGSTLICGVLAKASYELVMTEVGTQHTIAYGLPTWLFLCALPLGFGILGLKFGQKWNDRFIFQWAGTLLVFVASWQASQWLASIDVPTLWLTLLLFIFLALGGPVFLVLGGLVFLVFLVFSMFFWFLY